MVATISAGGVGWELVPRAQALPAGSALTLILTDTHNTHTHGEVHMITAPTHASRTQALPAGSAPDPSPPLPCPPHTHTYLMLSLGPQPLK